MSSTIPGKSLTLATAVSFSRKGRVAQITLVDGGEQQRRIGKEFPSILAREDAAGPSTVTMRSGLGPSAKMTWM